MMWGRTTIRAGMPAADSDSQGTSDAGRLAGPHQRRITSGSARRPCSTRPSCACPRDASQRHQGHCSRRGSRSSDARSSSSRDADASSRPSSGEPMRSATLDLDRHLVGRATNTTALDLKSRLDVVERALEGDDRVGARLGASALQGAVDDGLGDGLLAVHEDLVDELGDQRRAVDRVDDKWPLRGGALAWHYFFSIFAPYLLRACLRFLTPWVSSEPRTILYRTPGRSFTRPPRTSTIECSCRL